jgi:hypothetical protein
MTHDAEERIALAIKYLEGGGAVVAALIKPSVMSADDPLLQIDLTGEPEVAAAVLTALKGG